MSRVSCKRAIHVVAMKQTEREREEREKREGNGYEGPLRLALQECETAVSHSHTHCYSRIPSLLSFLHRNGESAPLTRGLNDSQTGWLKHAFRLLELVAIAIGGFVILNQVFPLFHHTAAAASIVQSPPAGTRMTINQWLER